MTAVPSQVPASHFSKGSNNPVAQSGTTLASQSSRATTVAGAGSLEDAQLFFPHADLPAADIIYTKVGDLFAAFEQARSKGDDCVVVAQASMKQFHALSRERDRRGSRLRLFYLAEHRIIIVTIPGFEHESLHTYLSNQVTISVDQMGLEWSNTAAQTFRPAGSASSGEGDSNGRPVPERMGKADWPTLVVEAGFSQSLQSLRAKMAFWFSASNNNVKVVILAKAFPNDDTKRILVEQWQNRPFLASRLGATTTRQWAQRTLQTTCVQTINIVWTGPVPYDQATVAQRRDCSHYNVTRGPLRLLFECLFLHPPTAPQEHDIILTDGMLQRYAACVWAS